MYRRRDGRVTTDGWLLWWGVSTVGGFTLTGNYGWYLLPAFVPRALLMAGLFDDALTGHLGALAGTTAGAALLLTHSFRIDGISPVATAKPMIHVTDGLPFVGLTLLGIVVVAVTGVHERTDLVRLAPTRVRRVLNNRWSRRLLAVGLFLCRIAVVVAPTNPAYQHGGTSQVKSLGDKWFENRRFSSSLFFDFRPTPRHHRVGSALHPAGDCQSSRPSP